jgi:hypothetical protein
MPNFGRCVTQASLSRPFGRGVAEPSSDAFHQVPRAVANKKAGYNCADNPATINLGRRSIDHSKWMGEGGTCGKVGANYSVHVDENFHLPLDDQRYKLGGFATLEEAVAACKRMVGDFLKIEISSE